MLTPTAKLEDFFRNFTKLTLDKHQVIIRADQQPRGVYFLKTGYIRGFSLALDGREFTIIIHKPGDCLPIWCLLNQELSNHYYFETMTRVQLLMAPREKLVKFLSENSDIFAQLAKEVAVRLSGLITRMEDAVFGNAYSKVASILAICAERFDKKIGQATLIQVPLRHTDIASLIGIARETASVEINKLKKRGLVKKRGSLLLITNLDRLRNEALTH